MCIRGNCFFAIVAVDIGGCTGVKIYSRDSWGARRPKSFSTFHTPASLFFVHHTAGNECHDFNSCASTLRGIQNYHMDTRGNKNEWNVNERGRHEMKRNWLWNVIETLNLFQDGVILDTVSWWARMVTYTRGVVGITWVPTRRDTTVEGLLPLSWEILWPIYPTPHLWPQWSTWLLAAFRKGSFPTVITCMVTVMWGPLNAPGTVCITRSSPGHTTVTLIRDDLYDFRTYNLFQHLVPEAWKWSYWFGIKKKYDNSRFCFFDL